jgi:GNAT superfamily N-acetyltransferase
MHFELGTHAQLGATFSMTISDGYTELLPGKIASVVTYLEMRERPQVPLVQPPSGLSVRKVLKPELDWYRVLYRAVGQDWLWFSRLRMSDSELAGIIHNRLVDVYALSSGKDDKGLLELDRRAGPDVEITYLGLTADFLGRGAGQFLMTKALDAAWAHTPARVWVHTCSLDHPRALEFYVKAGFVPYKRSIEIADDPRISGLVPRKSAPHVPLIESD